MQTIMEFYSSSGKIQQVCVVYPYETPQSIF